MKTFLFALCLAGLAGNAQAAEGKTELTWMGHAAWLAKTPGGAVIAIDPWFDNPKAPKDAKIPEKIDIILVTHGHFDHTGTDLAAFAKKTGAAVLGSYELVGSLGLPEDKAMGANPGGTVTIKDATIHVTEAVHSSSDKNGKYTGIPVGFVVAVDKGPVFYHAGDTDVFSSMALIGERYHPKFAMLPVGGHFTMDPQSAALAAKLLKVSTVIPMHFGTFPALAGTPEQLKSALGKTAKVMEFKPGEPAQI